MPDNPLLLIVEDDAAFARTLKRSFERRSYEVMVASGIEHVQELLGLRTPTHAVVDLKLGGSACTGAPWRENWRSDGSTDAPLSPAAISWSENSAGRRSPRPGRPRPWSGAPSRKTSDRAGAPHRSTIGRRAVRRQS